MTENLEPGDLVIFDRGPFKHWAVYVGNGEVIHFTKDCGILKQNLNEVKGKSRVTLEQKTSPYTGKEIVARAKTMMVNKTWGEYDVLRNNCEHFATWCRYNKAVSKQGNLGIAVEAVAHFARTGDAMGSMLGLADAASRQLYQ